MKFPVSSLAICAFFAVTPALAQDHLDANGMPTDHSTPAERAQTADLNNQIQQDNAATDAKAAQDNARYQAEQEQYRSQMQQHQAQQERYVDQTAAYENLRDRYAAERRAYHRALWPDRYRNLVLERDARLVGSRVEIVNGDRVGTVEEVARTPAGDVEALRVNLDSGKTVWIDEADARFDRRNDLVVTDLDRGDLHQMADERL